LARGGEKKGDWYGKPVPDDRDFRDIIREHLNLAYGLGGLTPAEFWDLTPAEFRTYIQIRDEWRIKEMEIENQRFGQICATFANVFRNKKEKSSPYVSSDFLSMRKQEPEQKANRLEQFYNAMMAWSRRSKK
jgi:hypothetical protein